MKLRTNHPRSSLWFRECFPKATHAMMLKTSDLPKIESGRNGQKVEMLNTLND